MAVSFYIQKKNVIYQKKTTQKNKIMIQLLYTNIYLHEFKYAIQW